MSTERQLNQLVRALVPDNLFYSAKIQAAGGAESISTLGEFYKRFPFTTKAELVNDQATHPPYGTNLTFPLDCYTRLHQTSGTTGAPLRWLDTPESWEWMMANWRPIFEAANVTRTDTLFFAFSFGPFLGFWLAFEAALSMGCRCLAGGGMSTVARLRVIVDNDVGVVCCTPTYALHLAEVAADENFDLAKSAVKTLVVAGEPGGCIPSTRARLEEAWPGARVFDHHGMTEVGPVTYECPARPRVLHVLESAYIAEIVDPDSGAHVTSGQTGELVLTTLGRVGSPVLRYRTGDLVRASVGAVCECGRTDMALEGGILGRTDEMVVVRGVNIYPSAVEDILRAHGGVGEYQVEVSKSASLSEIAIRVEPLADGVDAASFGRSLGSALQTAFNLRVPVTVVARRSLPRFEMKAHRWLRV